jgi:dihydrodipicolinate synthase/N-acetylneuraminate lyase
VVSGGANLLPSEWSEIVTASLNMSEDRARNLLILQQSRKLRELSQVMQKKPAQILKMALHRLGWLAAPKVLDSPQESSLKEEEGLISFLQAHFSLQTLP